MKLMIILGMCVLFPGCNPFARDKEVVIKEQGNVKCFVMHEFERPRAGAPRVGGPESLPSYSIDIILDDIEELTIEEINDDGLI